tara:strand:- start:16372 stop:16851 length:480 start_codon:yes stop_codon:yes gene_type:complete
MAKEVDITLFEKINGEYFYDKKLLKVHKNSQGYEYVRVNKKSRRLHRLIAVKYVPNPLGLKIVDHKDDCKTNNEIGNLQWTTHSDNSRKAYNNNTSMRNMHSYKTKNRKIISEKDGVIIKHDSLRICAKYLGRDVAAVHRCAKGEWNLCNGHKLTEIYE